MTRRTLLKFAAGFAGSLLARTPLAGAWADVKKLTIPSPAFFQQDQIVWLLKLLPVGPYTEFTYVPLGKYDLGPATPNNPRSR